MIVALVIAILVMAACMALLTFKVIKVEQKAENTSNEAKAKAVSEKVDRTITTYNQSFQSMGARQDEADRQIEEIISKLESIAVSIGNLENRQTVDRRKLNDICTRYVLYRNPEKVTAEDIAQALTEYKGGVPWAKYQPCNDEGE